MLKNVTESTSFFANFLIESHYLDHPLFKQTFFVKESHFSIFIHYHFFLFTKPFYSIHVIFFLPILNHPKIFFLKKTNKTLVFRFFSSFIQNKTLPYFEKETEWETIFFVFFQKFKTHFFVLTRVKFSEY